MADEHVNYISSDDEPYHTYPMSWEDFSQDSTERHQRFRSETDPYFLLRAQIVSTDSSSLDSPNDLDQTLTNDTPSNNQNVFDFTEALDALNADIPNHVVNLQNLPPPVPLPRRTSRSSTPHDYKQLHNHGFQK